MKKQGKVYLVGAGPSDPGLITVRGRALIEKADCLIYDYLVNSQLLPFASAKADKIYVGKKAAQHTMPQANINKLLVKKAKQGKTVVRLKGGDPFIFGRGGEEALYLRSKGVDFEIVPGVTSAIAAPAYAGIPLTHRNYTSTLGLITGHEKPDKNKSSIDWAKIAEGLGTIVFLMGVSNLPLIIRKLLKHGRSKSTPIALVRRGTSTRQQTLTGTLDNIVDRVRKKDFKPPAIIIVGKVVNLRNKLKWFENKPLFGKRIVVTRSRAQASSLVSSLRDMGAETIEYPVIKITPLSNYTVTDRAIKKISLFDWLILTSANGVDYFFKRLFKFTDIRSLAGVKIAAIGPATSERLKAYGIISDCQPKQFVAESIIKTLSSKKQIKSKKILLARASDARQLLFNELKRKGAKVTEVKLYKTILESDLSEFLREEFKQGQIDMVTFTSSSTVNNFVKLVGKDVISKNKKVKIASIGPVTTDQLKEHGLKPNCQARTYTIPGLVKTILSYFKS